MTISVFAFVVNRLKIFYDNYFKNLNLKFIIQRFFKFLVTEDGAR